MSSTKHNPRAAPARAARIAPRGPATKSAVVPKKPVPFKSKTAHARPRAPAFSMTIELNPLLALIRRHANLTPSSAKKLRQDLTAFMGQPVNLVVGESRKSAPAEPPDEVLSTQEAAELLGVSRPYFVRMVDSGAVPLHQMAGDQRRVRKSEVLAWQRREQAARRRAMGLLMDEVDKEVFG